LWDRKVNRRDVRRGASMVRNPTVLRTVQIPVITFIVTCSSLSSLRGIRRGFRPIFSMN
jgi:hypothetical protein